MKLPKRSGLRKRLFALFLQSLNIGILTTGFVSEIVPAPYAELAHVVIASLIPSPVTKKYGEETEKSP